jgi:hypothetical protein
MRCELSGGLQRALPYGHHSPAGRQELLSFTPVAEAIGFELLAPELFPRGGDSREATAVGVPEASVDEYGGFESREDYIWRAGEVPGLKTKAETEVVQGSP